MQFKMPSARWILVVLLLVPVGWLLIWFLFSLITHSPMGSVSELSGLLATLGGIMGTAFTVGGLILALVAVLSQITLEDRAKRVMEDKFNELAPDLEKRADQRIAGRIAYRDALQALQEQDWGSAEAYANEALEQYPDLPHVKSKLALGMAEAVVAWFSRQLVGQFTMTADQLHGMLGEGGLQMYDSDPPTAQAIEWLDTARRSGDDPGGRVSAAQALLYGMTGAYDKMLMAVKRALEADAANKTTHNKDSLTQSERLPMLIYACANFRVHVQQLGKELGIDLPIPIDRVRDSLNQIGSDPFVDHVNWHAVEVSLAQQSSKWVTTVLIFKKEDKERGQVAKAHVFRRKGGMYEIRSDQEDGYFPVSELMSKLDSQFMFICQTYSGT